MVDNENDFGRIVLTMVSCATGRDDQVRLLPLGQTLSPQHCRHRPFAGDPHGGNVVGRRDRMRSPLLPPVSHLVAAIGCVEILVAFSVIPMPQLLAEVTEVERSKFTAPHTNGMVTVHSAVARDQSPPLVFMKQAARGNEFADALPEIAIGWSAESDRHERAEVAERSVLVSSRVRAHPHFSDRRTTSTKAINNRSRLLALAAQPVVVTEQKNEAKTHSSVLTARSVEQIEHGSRPPPSIVASFDGLGEGFEGPQGTARFRNPSDNTLAVGPDHIVQIVNTSMAVFTKKGSRFDTTGDVLYGPVETRNVFKGCGTCGEINNGDAVVRYDQLANRWLIVMPIFRRLPPRENEPAAGQPGGPAQRSHPIDERQPGAAAALEQPSKPTEEEIAAAADERRQQRRVPQQRRRNERGSYAMCYAISTGPDPLGSYYRYEFVRPLFPDYPRPAVWPDGYYVPTSTGDDVIQKHACVVDRQKMLQGESATEQCFIIDDVNFLNNADLDGRQLPPPGSPNIMMATGGAQLHGMMEDDGIYVWNFHVDWDEPAQSSLDGPEKIPVAPYYYLCGGQLTSCVPQPGTRRRLDAQGDKIMARLAYRRIGDQQSIVAVHSVNTSAGGGGVRWYEFRLDGQREVQLHQQGTYAPGGFYRWMASPAIDALGNIGIGYSFGGTPHFPGQRFAARLAGDPLGVLTLREVILAEGEAAQTNTLRWEDYTQTAVDPSDDCTIWYVGDYLKEGADNYSSRIGAFRLPGCEGS